MTSYPTPFHVWWPDLGEEPGDFRLVLGQEHPEDAAEHAARIVQAGQLGARIWPMEAVVYAPETKQTWKVSVDLDWQPVFRTRAVEEKP